jgi:hypothetical protein
MLFGSSIAFFFLFRSSCSVEEFIEAWPRVQPAFSSW